MPPLSASQSLDGYRIFDLDRLITMKLTAFPGKVRPHPRDMIDVGLVDAATLDRLPAPLRRRLEQLLANPDGSLAPAELPASAAVATRAAAPP